MIRIMEGPNPRDGKRPLQQLDSADMMDVMMIDPVTATGGPPAEAERRREVAARKEGETALPARLRSLTADQVAGAALTDPRTSPRPCLRLGS